MRTFYTFLFTGIIMLAATAQAQTTASYNDVLLIVNDSSRNSTDIGNFFAQRRHIPAQNIYHIALDTSIVYDANYGAGGETIDSLTFKQKVWFPLEAYMHSKGLDTSINYIVTTKGDPLRVTVKDAGDNNTSFSGLASFNDCLALINGADSVYVLARKVGGFAASRYYNTLQHFKHDKRSMPYYLATRLDAYTVDQIKSYIMKSDSTAVVGQGLFVLDVDPSKDGTPQNPSGYKVGNDWLRDANTKLLAQYMNVFLDTTTIYVTKEKNVIGYASWGSNDNYATTYDSAQYHEAPDNTYLDGAIGETYVSTGGRSFTVGTGYGQSLIADWIVEGISGIKGYTDEPYLTVMAEPDILFPLYINGFNMAESYWCSSPLIAWRQVVIGDPKMMLKQALSASTQNITLPDTERYVSESMQVKVPNTSGMTFSLHKPYMDASGDTSQFSVSVNGVTLPYQYPAGDTLSYTVTYRGKQFGAAGGTVDVPYRLPGNNHDNLYQLNVNGRAMHPKMGTPDTIFFPAANYPDTSKATLSIRNNSKEDSILISAYGFGLSTSGFFQFQNVSDDKADTIFAGDSLTIPFMYIPTDTSQGETTFDIKSNASLIPTTPRQVVFIGYGSPVAVRQPNTVLPPDDLSLAQNYPNPFSQFTGLHYFIPQDANLGRISLQVYNVLGAQVADLTHFITTPGNGMVFLNAASLPEGTYYCRLSDGRMTHTIEMLHVK